MKRAIETHLNNWVENPNRKVLLLRGARQVGKTYSIRELSKRFDHYLEINFEMDKSVHHFFSSDLNPDEICKNLSAYYNIPIADGKTLLFFDEIQTCLPAISSLRFFHEKRPNLHVVAAGSLLEFALQDISSFGVGRIQFLFMHPMSFAEFLWAKKEEQLNEVIRECDPQHPINEAFHQKLITYLKQFLFIGGLPEVVDTYIKTDDIRQSQAVLDYLINGLEDDFSKYSRLFSSIQLREVFQSIAAQTGSKFTISKASERMSYQKINEALTLLQMAGLAHIVKHSSADGIPLGAGVNPKKFKVILFDHGIFQRLLGLDLSEHLIAGDFETINKGNIAEQFVGTELIKYRDPYNRAQLFYWHREKRGSNAEVDYVIQKSDMIIPIEVKSGKQGKMQSLWMFLNEKKREKGIRISLENFSNYPGIDVFPLYAIQNILS